MIKANWKNNTALKKMKATYEWTCNRIQITSKQTSLDVKECQSWSASSWSPFVFELNAKAGMLAAAAAAAGVLFLSYVMVTEWRNSFSSTTTLWGREEEEEEQQQQQQQEQNYKVKKWRWWVTGRERMKAQQQPASSWERHCMAWRLLKVPLFFRWQQLKPETCLSHGDFLKP